MIISGFLNEMQILIEFNKKFSELTSYSKQLIQFLFSDIKDTDFVKCTNLSNNSKADLMFEVNSLKFGISIKSGSGNSVHQEPVEKFISYISNNLNATQEECNAIRLFIWGDGSLDGKGNPTQRIGSPEFQRQYPSTMKTIQNFFDKNTDSLLRRFIVTGVAENLIPADYLYYGSRYKGTIIKTVDAVEFLSNRHKFPGVGGLTFQAWNRNLVNKQNSTEKKRGVIQLKWGNISAEINQVYRDK